MGRFTPDASRVFDYSVATSVTLLWTDHRDSEKWYQAGKVQNLRVAALLLDGISIPAGEVFSFWRHVGRATKRRGFTEGRMLQQGCLIPAVGGGLCQLSNSLYEVALKSGCKIIERHAHSQVVPGSAAALDRDATVAWNYIDLRFSPPVSMRLDVQLTALELIVSLRSEQKVEVAPMTSLPIVPLRPHAGPGDCDTCGQVDCFRHRKR